MTHPRSSDSHDIAARGQRGRRHRIWRTRFSLAGHCTLAVLLAVAGCSNTPSDVAEVKGKVTLDGRTLSGVNVTFYPETEAIQSPPYSRGTTDAEGVYQLELASGESKHGAIVGKCRVVVNWPLEGRDNPIGGPDAKARPLIPLPYTSASDTPLHVEVKAGGLQTIDLSLKSTGAP